VWPSAILSAGVAGREVRSRVFTAAEIAAEVQAVGLRVIEMKGVSALSIILGYLQNRGALAMPAHGTHELLSEVHALLVRLGRAGRLLRSHVVIAAPFDDPPGISA
jgi:hypothetical protein